MFGNRRHYSLIAIASLALLACAWVDRGYLAAIGPAAAAVQRAADGCPPQVIHSAPAASAIGTRTSETRRRPKPRRFADPPPSAAVTPEPSARTNEVSSVHVEPDRPEEVVSPQMLIKYFNKSTNGVTSSVILPADFTPPKPAEPPSSKATYSIGP